ncbi:MAG: polyamine aminopropyltransferase [Planctomycetes bacterium]|nr:polyamine aminopropyltransferase [Planctomycetota bacterium]
MPTPPDALRLRAVFATVFVVAACGLAYELVAGALASYLLGDSVAQFSTAIGLYLCALGIGAWLSKFVETRVVERFVQVEAAVALLGGTLAAVLFLAFPSGRWFRPVLYGEILGVGTLVGLEIPLLLRILKDDMEFKDLVSRVLTFDYVGSLAVALAFPHVLVPHLGLVRTALALGLLNAFVGLWSTYVFEHRLERPGPLRARCVLVVLLLTAGMAWGDRATLYAETSFFGEEILHARTSPFQRIVVAGTERSFSLYLNGALQFHSGDERRYHEALVHPAMAVSPDPRRVLVLGGGDGLAVREVLRHPSVERVTLVDIDRAVTDLARDVEAIARLNARALSDPRVEVVNDDAMAWLDARRGPYDVAVVDFPDPSSFAVGKLYTVRFYERLLAALAPDGAVVVQATSPFHARRSFWCVARTLEATGLTVRPYRAFVPSFRGDWGFLLASRRAFAVPDRVPAGLSTLDVPSMQALFVLGPDLGPLDVEVNRLDNQVLVRYYDEEWRAFGG